MSTTLSVTAIKDGTVIDHITEGQSARIIHLLSLRSCKNTITVGLHLPSTRVVCKDIIKIENRILTDEEASDVAIFAPLATINTIADFKVVKKMKACLPDQIKNIFICANNACITQAEKISSMFYLQSGKQMDLLCHYCDKTYNRDELKLQIYS